jgi:SpoVK/Ycf46/Vps4 family AAA+-type ATPase
VVATANDIHKLPPELVRKGRFDEIFFVDLPTPEVREAILRLHLRKRGRAPEGFDLASLVKASEGFSGAEIEQAIVAALYTAFDSGAELSTALLLEEIGATEPLSKTMGEAVAALRAWAKGRTVSAE